MEPKSAALRQRKQLMDVRREKMQRSRALRAIADAAQPGGALTAVESPSTADVLPARRGPMASAAATVGAVDGLPGPRCGQCAAAMVNVPEQNCWCDACASAGLRTRGTLYKCSVACDYDLCGACYATKVVSGAGTAGCGPSALASKHTGVAHVIGAADAAPSDERRTVVRAQGVSAQSLQACTEPVVAATVARADSSFKSTLREPHRRRRSGTRRCTSAGDNAAVNMLKQSRPDGSVNRARRVRSAMDTRNNKRLEQQSRLSRILPLLDSKMQHPSSRRATRSFSDTTKSRLHSQRRQVPPQQKLDAPGCTDGTMIGVKVDAAPAKQSSLINSGSEPDALDSFAVRETEQAALCLREYTIEREAKACAMARMAREAAEAEHLRQAQELTQARREARMANEQRDAAKAELDREVRARRYPRNNGALSSVQMPRSPRADAAGEPARDAGDAAVACLKAKINWVDAGARVLASEPGALSRIQLQRELSLCRVENWSIE